MNAPKKIWVDKGGVAGTTRWFDTDTPYIRADLVDGLVEALEHYCKVLEKLDMTTYWGEAALAALKEEE